MPEKTETRSERRPFYDKCELCDHDKTKHVLDVIQRGGVDAHTVSCQSCLCRLQVDPSTWFPKVEGRKFDQDKPRWDLLPYASVLEVVKVLTFGAKKYEPDNWQKVDNAKNRYFRAAVGHLASWRMGERNDPESGLSHLAHAACCVLFMIWFDSEK